MAETILPAFIHFPKEGAIVGRLLASYGELELNLCNSVGSVRNDQNMVFKAMFRPRGETQRIDVADAIGRTSYSDLNLETKFAEAIAGVRYCLKIRNQYAHCVWHYEDDGMLGFLELEESAKSNKPMEQASVTIRRLDVLVVTA